MGEHMQSLCCPEHEGHNEQDLQEWFDDLLVVREGLSQVDFAQQLGYGVDGWHRTLSSHLFRHFGCYAANITYFKPHEKRDQLITPTWIWQARSDGLPRAVDEKSFGRYRAVYRAGSHDEMASLAGGGNELSRVRPTAFERKLACKLMPDGEVSYLSLLYLARLTAGSQSKIDQQTLVYWMQALGLLQEGEAATCRLQRMLSWLHSTPPESHGHLLPKALLEEAMAGVQSAFRGAHGGHPTSAFSGLDSVLEGLAASLQEAGHTAFRFGLNILGHLAMRLVRRPQRGDPLGLREEVHELFDVIDDDVLDRTCTDRSIVILPLTSAGEGDGHQLSAYYLGGHVGLSPWIERLRDDRQGRLAAWPYYGRLASSIEAVTTPVLVRSILDQELPKERFGMGLQVLGHHVGKLFQESGMFSLEQKARGTSLDEPVREVVARLRVAWGVAEATRAMKYQGRGLPPNWLPSGYRPPQTGLNTDKMVEQIVGLCRYYFAGFGAVLAGHWQVEIAGERLSIDELRKLRLEFPSLAPFSDGENRAATTSITLGLAELIRNVRHYICDYEVDYARALSKGLLNQPIIRIVVESGATTVAARIEYSLVRRTSGHSRSLARIQAFERELLSVDGRPVAATEQVKLAVSGARRWIPGVATWTYHPYNVKADEEDSP